QRRDERAQLRRVGHARHRPPWRAPLRRRPPHQRCRQRHPPQRHLHDQSPRRPLRRRRQRRLHHLPAKTTSRRHLRQQKRRPNRRPILRRDHAGRVGSCSHKSLPHTARPVTPLRQRTILHT